MSTCPECKNEMEAGYLYVRGFGGFYSAAQGKDAKFLSRRDLAQIDLGRLSVVRPRAQAVLPAGKCSKCGMVSFKAFP
jgi:hypothetical protein